MRVGNKRQCTPLSRCSGFKPPCKPEYLTPAPARPDAGAAFFRRPEKAKDALAVVRFASRLELVMEARCGEAPHRNSEQ